MDKKVKKINGNIDVDTEAMALMRQEVVQQELSARSWKAYYEKMYFTLESEKLEQPYAEYQERARKKLEEHKKRMEDFNNSLKAEIEKANQEDPVGEIKLEEVNEAPQI